MTEHTKEEGFTKNILTYLTLLSAGLLYAAALKYFVLPSKVILTGTEGIAASISYFVQKDWIFILLYTVFQAGLIAFAYRSISKPFAIKSLIVVVTVILTLLILPDLHVAKPEPENERILLVIFGGILAGIAKAIAFRQRGSTGDEDILGAFFATKYLKPVGYIAIISAVVSTTFGLGLKLIEHPQIGPALNTLMYTSIYIFVSAETLNNFYKKFQITMVTIVTQHPDHVGASLTNATGHRTYTLYEGKGGHSKEKYWVMRTIITHEELPETLKSIEESDANSFYYYHKVEGVSGNYYIEPIG
ncbi:MAG: hypothetical protein CL920_24265 [Deltaproteobacteria bacterium]|nr:hypothetical protein [Deltaproteobacteria bacterium]